MNINTGLDGFKLVDRITHVDADRISGMRTFLSAPPYQGIEALAQLGALHVRYLIDFERSVFLLKIGECQLNVKRLLDGAYTLTGRITGQSSSAVSHYLKLEKNDQVFAEGKFMFAIKDYDDHFKRDMLEPHYRERFSCLQKESKLV